MSIIEKKAICKLDTLKPPKANRKNQHYNHTFTIKQSFNKRELKANNLWIKTDTFFINKDLSFTNSLNEFNKRGKIWLDLYAYFELENFLLFI